MNNKYFENVDLKLHLTEFAKIFLPIFVLIGAIVLAIWINLKPEGSSNLDAKDSVAISRPDGHPFVGLLNASKKQPLFDPAFAMLSPIEMVTAPIASTFSPPMGSEHQGLTYNAQPFLVTRHLGDDLNGIGGQNSDLGDAVYAVADGQVIYAGWPADGWGNVAILLHELPDGRMLQSFYGHLDRIGVYVGQRVRRGDQIGDVGNANGAYLAHLHFELRTAPSLDCGAGYADAELDRLAGEYSLYKWRGRPDDVLAPAPKGTTPDAEALGVDTQP